jgi:hypothetical protein
MTEPTHPSGKATVAPAPGTAQAVQPPRADPQSHEPHTGSAEEGLLHKAAPLSGLLTSSLLGRLLALAGLLPLLAMVWTTFFLLDPFALAFEPVTAGIISALLTWLTFAVLTIDFGQATLSNAAQYQGILQRAGTIASEVGTVCAADKPAAGEVACATARALSASLGKDLDSHQHAGIPWVTGESYVQLWRRIHAAEEQLLVVSSQARIRGAAGYDKARLTDSTIGGAAGMLDDLKVAIATLSVPAPGAAPPSTEAMAEAAATVCSVRHAINDFRDDRWAGLVRLRRRMTLSLVLTGVTAYLVLAIVVIALGGDPVYRSAILTGCVYFLIGAVVGLLFRIFSETTQEYEVEDFGLSTARLFHAPVVSGLAAVGGVVLSAIVATYPLGLSIMANPVGSTSEQGTTLVQAFDIGVFPFALVLAAVFGLTPGLFFDNLRKVGNDLKVDIIKSSSAGSSG